MSIKGLALAGAIGLLGLGLAGCVDGGPYYGDYVYSGYYGPYFGPGYYGPYYGGVVYGGYYGGYRRHHYRYYPHHVGGRHWSHSSMSRSSYQGGGVSYRDRSSYRANASNRPYGMTGHRDRNRETRP